MHTYREFSVQALLEQRDFVRALALRLTQDSDEAGDVEQETWLSVLERGPKQIEDARLWLAGLARRLAFSRKRSESRRRVREMEREDVQPHRSQGVEATERLMASLLQLDERYRMPLMMRFFDGQSVHQIAASMELPFETVRTRIRRGLDLLRTDLDQEFGDRKAWVTGFACLASPAISNSGWTTPLLIASGAAAIAGVLIFAESPEPRDEAVSVSGLSLALEPGTEGQLPHQSDADSAQQALAPAAPGQKLAQQQTRGTRPVGVPATKPVTTASGGMAGSELARRTAVGSSEPFAAATAAYWSAVAAAREGAQRFVAMDHMPAGDAAVLEALLSAKLDAVDWSAGTSVSKALAHLGHASGLSFQVDPKSEPERLEGIQLPSFHLPHAIALEQCLDLIIREAGLELTWWIESSVVFVGSREEQAKRHIRFEHSIQDFFIQAADYFPSGADFYPIFAGNVDPFLFLLTEEAANGSWEQLDGVESGKLRLQRSARGHLRAQALLDHLRQFFVPERWERQPGTTRNYFAAAEQSAHLLMQMERVPFPYAAAGAESSLAELEQRLAAALEANVLATQLLQKEYPLVAPQDPAAKGLSVRAALDQLQTQEASFRWQAENGVLVLYNVCEMPKVAFAIYDLRQVLGTSQWSAQQLKSEWPQLAQRLDTGESLSGDLLVAFIQAEISSASWDESPSYKMSFLDSASVLYVTQHPDAQAQIAELVASLHALALQAKAE